MANANYETARAKARKAGDWNGVVPADEARRHILALGRAGLGRRAVSRASGVGRTCIQKIRSGHKTHIRARTARLILAVTPDMRLGAALVSAARLWRRIGLLLEEGFSKADLAQRLGYATRAIQFRRNVVTVRSDRRVAQLYRTLTS